MDKTLKSSSLSLLINIAFSAYHITFGVVTHSWWLFTVGVYYLILSIMRFVVLITRKNIQFITKFTGIMLMVLSIPLAGTVILAVVTDRGTVFHMIVMIAMATYTFTKVTLAVINLIRAKKHASQKVFMLRNISLATAAVSLFSLQRSMLVSFEGMTAFEIQIMNAATGSAVCVAVFVLGINLLQKRYEK